MARLPAFIEARPEAWERWSGPLFKMGLFLAFRRPLAQVEKLGSEPIGTTSTSTRPYQITRSENRLLCKRVPFGWKRVRLELHNVSEPTAPESGDKLRVRYAIGRAATNKDTAVLEGASKVWDSNPTQDELHVYGSDGNSNSATSHKAQVRVVEVLERVR